MVSDVVAYLVDGDLYEGMPFEVSLPSDEDGPPRAQLRVQNVDPRIGEAIRGAGDRVQARLDLRSSADFDLSQDPRTTLGSVPVHGFRAFELIDITVTPLEVSGTLFLRDYAQEPWPGLRATQSRSPGLFR